MDNNILDNNILDNNILDNNILDNNILDNNILDNNILDNNILDNNICDISKIIICNEYLILKKKNNVKLLNFNEKEKKNYDIYINKFKDIYESNCISFDNDDYLKKYCCYTEQIKNKLLFIKKS